jgi:hypothetical protein
LSKLPRAWKTTARIRVHCSPERLATLLAALGCACASTGAISSTESGPKNLLYLGLCGLVGGIAFWRIMR